MQCVHCVQCVLCAHQDAGPAAQTETKGDHHAGNGAGQGMAGNGGEESSNKRRRQRAPVDYVALNAKLEQE